MMTSSNNAPLKDDPVVDYDEDTSSTDLPAKPWDPRLIRITTKNFTIREIYTQIKEGDLDLTPDFQRSFVWRQRQQIRLVESILLGIPLPAFYFNQDKEGAHQVIDGVQRLTTVKLFMSDCLLLDEKHLEYLRPLKGLGYNTLDPATRRRFAGTQIVAHVIEPQTPDDVKYDIFNRVNTGGSPLTPQEIRHCMSKAESRAFLNSLVELPSFDKATGKAFWRKNSNGDLIRDNLRMTDRELALRFCAFYTVSLDEYQSASSLDAFLLEYTRRLDHATGSKELNLSLEELKSAFNRAMENSSEILGEAAFRRWPPNALKRGPINRAIFESQALALAKYKLDELMPHRAKILERFRQLFADFDYDNAVRSSTGDHRKVEIRLTKPRQVLTEIMQ
jgi:hypothetical protein